MEHFPRRGKRLAPPIPQAVVICGAGSSTCTPRPRLCESLLIKHFAETAAAFGPRRNQHGNVMLANR
jgi:hypothetical protein